VAEELSLPVRTQYLVNERDGKYYIKVMDPLSETNKRGRWAWRKSWEIDITEEFKKMPK
jgi:hypothetical protein